MTRTGDSVYHRKDGLWEARYVKEIDAFGKKKYGSVYGHSKREAREKRQDAKSNAHSANNRCAISARMVIYQSKSR